MSRGVSWWGGRGVVGAYGAGVVEGGSVGCGIRMFGVGGSCVEGVRPELENGFDVGPADRRGVPHVVIVLGKAKGLESAVTRINDGRRVGGSTCCDVRIVQSDMGSEGGREIGGKPRCGVFGIGWRGKGGPSRKVGEVLVIDVGHRVHAGVWVRHGFRCTIISTVISNDATV